MLKQKSGPSLHESLFCQLCRHSAITLKAGTSLAAERPQRLGPHAGKACPARLLHQLPAQHC